MELLALFAALALVGLNAFFVATEFAIVKVRPTRIEELTRKGKPGAGAVRHIVANLDAYLSATQIGVTLASLALGWIGEPAFAALAERPLALAGITDPVWVHRIALSGAFLTITILHIVLGELAPKTLSILRAESVALAVAVPMRIYYALVFPGVWALNGLTRASLRLLGVTQAMHGEQHSEEEIRIILSQARSAGLLQPSRAELLSKALTLPTKTARHLMVPRNDVIILDANLDWAENLARAMEAGHTRFPLCDRELDDVIGIVDIRGALYACQSHGAADLRALATAPVYVPEMMSAERLMSELRARKARMAIVVDEYGGASGIVTAADVVTAVMGEFDVDDANDVVPLPGGVFEIDGVATLDEVNEALRSSLASETMHTVAGFLMERLGRLPKVGDRVVEQGYAFNVLEVLGPRVQKVRVQREGAGDAARRPAASRRPATAANDSPAPVVRVPGEPARPAAPATDRATPAEPRPAAESPPPGAAGARH